MDINFLPDKQEEKDRKKKKPAEKKIEWSEFEADGGETPAAEAGAKKNGRGGVFGFFRANSPFKSLNLFQSKEKDKKDKLTDKAKIKTSRKDLLKFIHENKDSQTAVKTDLLPEAVAAGRSKNGIKQLFSGLGDLFKKYSGQTKDSLLKYHHVLAAERKSEPVVSEREKPKPQASGESAPPAIEAKKDDFSARAAASELRPEHKKDEDRKAGERKEDLPQKTEKAKPPAAEKKEAPEEKADKKVPHILETNLIKDEIIVFFDWQKNVFYFLLFFISACLLVAGAYGVLSWREHRAEAHYQEIVNKSEGLDQQITSKKKEMADIFVFREKLKLASILLDQHIYWTPFFDFLEKNTLGDVYYLGFAGDTEGEYVLPAVARDFGAIESQVKQLLNNKYVLKAEVEQGSTILQDFGEGTTSAVGAVSFDLNLSVDPSIFTAVITNK